MSRPEKRPLERDGTDGSLEWRQRAAPPLGSSVDEAALMDFPPRIESSLESLNRRMEVIERAIARLAPGSMSAMHARSPDRAPTADSSTLRLQFPNKLNPILFTGVEIKGEGGIPIYVVLEDVNSGRAVTAGAESSLKLEVVVLDGGFSADDDESWTQDVFERYIVREREGKPPLLTGDLSVSMKGGVGTLGELKFTDNSSWTRSRKFRLGVKLAPKQPISCRIREAKTEAFIVKDHPTELYEKHYPPAPNDEVWRLERIRKDGAFHKRLNAAGIFTVEEFFRNIKMNPQRLRDILCTEISDEMGKGTASTNVNEDVALNVNEKGLLCDHENVKDNTKDDVFNQVSDADSKNLDNHSLVDHLPDKAEGMGEFSENPDSFFKEASGRGITRLAPGSMSAMHARSPDRAPTADSSTLRLQFPNKLNPILFTGVEIKGKGGIVIYVVLEDANSLKIVTAGAESSLKLEVVVLDGGFSADDDESWTQDVFERYIVREREGKPPLLTGDLSVSMKGGVGTLGELKFTDNSSWTRSRKFRLGVKLAPKQPISCRIREAKTEAFIVKDHPTELYKKHYPPAPNDEVWRLDGIRSDGVFHKLLSGAKIYTVGQFLSCVETDPHRLRDILGPRMTGKMWKITTDHAKTCVMNPNQVGGFNQVPDPNSQLRHGMLANPDVIPDMRESNNEELNMNQMNRPVSLVTSKKATIGWLKLKAAFRLGFFVRKKAAERKAASLVEMEFQTHDFSFI